MSFVKSKQLGYPLTGSFSGSFFGNGAGLTNISASGIVGLNLSQISSGSVTASISPNLGFTVNTNAAISGNLSLYGSLIGYNSSSFIGNLAGQSLTAPTYSVYVGEQSGLSSSYSAYTTLVGAFSGLNSVSSSFLTALGYSSAVSSSSSLYSTVIGPYSGYSSYGIYGSNVIGWYAATLSSASYYSTIIGPYAGYQLNGGAYSTILGYNAAFSSSLGNNNIVIGTNVTLASGSSNSINIGGLIFGSGSYFSTGSVSSGSVNGCVGINQPNPQYNLDVNGTTRISGTTTAISGSTVSTLISSSLYAVANNDNLSVLSINPTFNNGQYSNVTNYNLWSKGAGKNVFGNDSNLDADSNQVSYNLSSRYSIINPNSSVVSNAFTTDISNTSNSSQLYITTAQFNTIKNDNFSIGTSYGSISRFRNNGSGSLTGYTIGSYNAVDNYGTSTMTNSYGLYGEVNNLGATGSATMGGAAVFGAINNKNSNNIGTGYSGWFQFNHYGSGTVSSATGMYAQTTVVSGASGSISLARGLVAQVYTQNGSNTPISAAYAISTAISHAGSGLITDGWNIRILSPTGPGPITNAYGIRMFGQARAGVTNAYGITQEGASDLNFFLGKTGFGLSTTPSAQTHILSTTEQLRVAYDASNYMSIVIANSGSTTFSLTGTNPTFTFNNNVTVTGTLTAQTLVVQTITASTEYSSGSNVFGNSLTNTQQLTGSVTVTGSLYVNNNSVITSNQTSSMSVLSSSYANIASVAYSGTGSFTGSLFGTSSQAVSASYSLSSSYGVSSSYSVSASSAISASASLVAVSASYSLSASVATNATNASTASNILGGSTNYVPVFNTNTSLVPSIIYQTGSTIILNQTGYSTSNPEALYAWQPSTSSFNVISGKGNLNSYLQLNIQNLNAGNSVSSDVVATANNGDENGNYIDMGINGQNYNGAIAFGPGGANDAYLYNTGSNLYIGNYSPGQSVYLFNGYQADHNPSLQIAPNFNIYISSSLYVTGSINGNLTGSLLGTASFAKQSVTASYANNFTVASTLTTQTIVSQTVMASSVYSSVSNFFGSSLTNTQVLTGSVSITGSLTVNNNGVVLNNQTASFATTGSNTFVGNQTVTGSINSSGSVTLYGSNTLTGSNTIVGNTVLRNTVAITGSLSVSGSTTQIGNNNLYGNTVLSGSLIVSGAQGTTIPNIQIFGDTDINGVLQFNPVAAGNLINTTVSASYVYVSGSTQDLYFSQNGNGYANTTRLRWLEGNLYTGLLNGGIISQSSSTTYTVSSGSGIIVNLNASLGTNPYPTITYLNWNTLSASIAPLSASYDQQFIAIQSVGGVASIYASGTPYVAGQYDTLIPIGLVLHQNRSTINNIKTQPSVAYGWKQRSNIFIKSFGPLKLSGFALSPSGSSTGSLVVSAGTAFDDGANYPLDPNNLSYVSTDSGTSVSKIWRYYQSGSGWVYQTNGGAGYTSIDPTQYSNNGTLTLVPGNGFSKQYSIQRVYWFPNSVTKAIVVYYGNATYTTQALAQAALNTETFAEAPNTANNAIYLGALIVRSDADFTNSTTYAIIPGGLFRSIGGISGGGGSITATSLASLSDVNVSEGTGIDKYALMWDNSTSKWIASNSLGVSITGNAATATSASNSQTASFVQNAQTASYVATSSYSLVSNTAATASYVLTAQTASYVTLSQTASYVLNAQTASYVTLAQTASYVTTAQTASYVLQAVSASYAVNSTTASYSVNTSNATTASYALVATSASYASTSSYASSTATVGYTIGGSTVFYNTVSSPGNVNQNIFTNSTGSFTSAFFNYTVYSGTNARTGQVMTVWNGSTVNYTDNSTVDIGSTLAVTASVSIVSGQIQFNVQVPTGTWIIKSTATYL